MVRAQIYLQSGGIQRVKTNDKKTENRDYEWSSGTEIEQELHLELV